MTGVLLAVDVVDLRAGDDWSAPRVEQILEDHAIRRPEIDEGSSIALRRWATRLRTVFAADSEQSRCTAVNGLLVDGVASVYLTTHDDLRPHLHFSPDDNDVVGRVCAVTAGGLALFTVESGGQRLGVCHSPGCDRVYADTSRNGRRRFCSARCANGVAVARHRLRTSST